MLFSFGYFIKFDMTVNYNIRYIRRTPNASWKNEEEKDLSDSDCSVELIPVTNSTDLQNQNNENSNSLNGIFLTS